MKKENSVSDIQAEQLPFFFIKKEIDASKVKANWQTIKKKIGAELPKPQSK